MVETFSPLSTELKRLVCHVVEVCHYNTLQMYWLHKIWRNEKIAVNKIFTAKQKHVGTLGDQCTHVVFTGMLGQRVQHFSEDTKMKDCRELGNRTCGI